MTGRPSVVKYTVVHTKFNTRCSRMEILPTLEGCSSRGSNEGWTPIASRAPPVAGGGACTTSPDQQSNQSLNQPPPTPPDQPAPRSWAQQIDLTQPPPLPPPLWLRLRRRQTEPPSSPPPLWLRLPLGIALALLEPKIPGGLCFVEQRQRNIPEPSSPL